MLALALDKLGVPFSGTWQIDEAEAKELAGAIVSVAKLYDMTPSPHVVAWSNLIGTTGVIYGTRYAAYRVQLEMYREQQRQRSGDAPPVTVDEFGNVITV